MPVSPRGAAPRHRRVPALAEIEAHVADAAALLRALANEQRLQVLCVLLEGPHSVREINARVTLSQSALSQHLSVLREARVVTTRRQSQTIWYAIAPGPAQHIIGALHAAYCAPPASARPASVTCQSREQEQCS